MRRARHGAAGFTLIEVMVALLIGGVALTGAAGLLRGLGGRAEQVARQAVATDRDANAERLLRSLLANLELSTDASPSLLGQPASATFKAWCQGPAGWLDHCTARLAFERAEGAPLLRLQLRGAVAETIDLRRGFRAGGLRYVRDAHNGGSWTNSWSLLVPPAAVAVIVDRDTTLLAVWSGG